MDNTQETLDNQKVLDKVIAHLFQQRYRCQLFSSCAYKGPNNTSCAVGYLIPQELYDRGMEGEPVQTLIKRYKGVASLFDGVSVTLLAALQGAHDEMRASAEHGIGLWGYDDWYDQLLHALHQNEVFKRANELGLTLSIPEMPCA